MRFDSRRFLPLASRLLVLVLTPAALGSARVHAQQPVLSRALFTPPPIGVDYARHYPHVEECLAAVARERRAARWGGPVEAGDPTRQEPAGVVQAAERCGERFTVERAAALDLPLLRELSHHAERDSVAEAVLARELALVPPGAAPEVRAGLLADALEFAAHLAHPGRVAWAERRLDQIEQLGWGARVARLRAYHLLTAYAGMAFDTLRLDRYAAAFFALSDSLSALERQRTYGWAIEARYLTRLRKLARGEELEPADSVAVPPVRADFWFRREDSTARRPSATRGGLVVFVDPDCGTRCYDRYAALREFGARFGDALEITLVTHTHGYFRNHPPLAPAEEAELLRRYLLEHLDLPGALAVETTPFGRLPAPDGRRVNRTPPNIIAYDLSNFLVDSGPGRLGFEFESDASQHKMMGVLVDRDGRILQELPHFGKNHRALLGSALAGWLAHAGRR